MFFVSELFLSITNEDSTLVYQICACLSENLSISTQDVISLRLCYQPPSLSEMSNPSASNNKVTYHCFFLLYSSWFFFFLETASCALDINQESKKREEPDCIADIVSRFVGQIDLNEGIFMPALAHFPCSPQSFQQRNPCYKIQPAVPSFPSNIPTYVI